MSSANATQYPLALPNGSRLDHYEIHRTLGSGAFGVTYCAFSHKFQSPCVIKELFPVDYATRAASTQQIVALSAELAAVLEKCRHDFMREATILHAVNHPNVVKILDFFGGNGTSYIVMPFVSGVNYEAWLKLRTPGAVLEEHELVAFMHPILDGLQSVHAKGYLHRDLKPENIILTESGMPLLIDFGAARQLIGSRSRPMSMILTRHYAPFEQYSTTMKQGPYTDIYAFGAVLHRAMTGQPPAEAPDRIDNGTADQPLAARLAGGRYSSRLLEAIDWALRPQANLRPQTIAAWKSALPNPPAPPRAARSETFTMLPPPPPPPVTPDGVAESPEPRSLPPPLPVALSHQQTNDPLPPAVPVVRAGRTVSVRVVFLLLAAIIVLTALGYLLLGQFFI